MKRYEDYKKAFPNKTDAQIIESLAWELSDKVETIGRLVKENEKLEEKDNLISQLKLEGKNAIILALQFQLEAEKLKEELGRLEEKVDDYYKRFGF